VIGGDGIVTTQKELYGKEVGCQPEGNMNLVGDDTSKPCPLQEYDDEMGGSLFQEDEPTISSP